MSLNKVEIVHGKLNHLAQLSPPLKMLLGEVIQQMREFLEIHSNQVKGSRKHSSREYEVNKDMKEDVKIMIAILADMRNNPLPIVVPREGPGSWALEVYTDVSGHLLDNPSLGVYSPAQGPGPALVASLALPRGFLLARDSQGKKTFCKTISLEALGVLATLCLDPLRFIGKEVVFFIDNIGTVISFEKGYSKDEWTTTIVRASRVIAAALGCFILVRWERRRSSKGSKIADDLTHNLLEGLSGSEVESFISLGAVSFPEAIQEWMASPGKDRSLGRRVFSWLLKEFPSLSVVIETE